MHEVEFDHEHVETPAERAAIARTIWDQDNVAFTTVGIDIGSSTSHLLFAKVALQRQQQGLSSRFVVVGREIVWRSPILLTPFLPDGTIDAKALGEFIARCYADAGFKQNEIDSGAVILTGEAIKRKNARAIDELFAEQAGKFVCATAGHKLESRLAAHGSGAVALSKARNTCMLHVDIGGGTTKLALIDRGTIVGLCAFAVGGRLIAQDDAGAWTRIDQSARLVADDLGIEASPQTFADQSVRGRVVQRLATVAADVITGTPLDSLGQSLLLTEPLPRGVAPTALTFSGGVAEYVFGHETAVFGDIAKPLAAALAGELSRQERPAADRSGPAHPRHRNRRLTIHRASQRQDHLSARSLCAAGAQRPGDPCQAGLHGGHRSGRLAAAIRRGLDEVDLDRFGRIAIAFDWRGDPEHSRLKAAGEGVLRALLPLADRIKLLLVMIDGDVGKTFGRLMHRELHWPGKLVSIDGMELQELDYVDVGELIAPPGVVPVVIKSLLFA